MARQSRNHRKNRGIPRVPRHHDNQPQPSRPPKTPETRTEPENARRKPIQSTRTPAAKQPATPTTPQNRKTPTVPRHHKDQPPTHRPHNHPSPRTEPEITSQNRNQSTPALANTQMPTTTPLQNRGRPTVRSFRHNPPPPGQIPEMPAPRTESENEPKKSIQSHNGTGSPGTPTTATLEMRNTSTIRQHREHQPPALRYPDSPYFRNY